MLSLGAIRVGRLGSAMPRWVTDSLRYPPTPQRESPRCPYHRSMTASPNARRPAPPARLATAPPTHGGRFQLLATMRSGQLPEVNPETHQDAMKCSLTCARVRAKTSRRDVSLHSPLQPSTCRRVTVREGSAHSRRPKEWKGGVCENGWLASCCRPTAGLHSNSNQGTTIARA